jgi:hypothetical protein
MSKPPHASVSEPFVAATFTQYGVTMLAVQTWEQELVTLVGAASLKAHTGKSVPFERALQKAFKRTWKQMHKQKASKLRKMLRDLADKDALTETLIEEISDLNEWRKFLAHDYLRTQIYTGTDPRPDPVLVFELFQIGQAFTAATERMAGATKILLTGAPKSETLKQVRAVVERFTQELPTVQPAPLETPSPDLESIGAASIKLWQRSGRRSH